MFIMDLNLSLHGTLRMYTTSKITNQTEVTYDEFLSTLIHMVRPSPMVNYNFLYILFNSVIKY